MTWLCRGGGFPLFKRKCGKVLLEIGGPEDEQRLHWCANVIPRRPFERFHVAFAKAVPRLVRVCGAHVKFGAVLVDFGDDGERRLFTGGKLNPDNVSAAEAYSGGHSVGIYVGRHGNVYLAKIRQRGGFELLVNLFGRDKFWDSFCHGLKDS